MISTYRYKIICMMASFGFLLNTFCIVSAYCENASKQNIGTQLNELMPDELDLAGFSANYPAGEKGADEVFKKDQWQYQDKPAGVVSDEIQLNVLLSQNIVPWNGSYSTIKRRMFSLNGLYQIDITVWLCDRADTAQYALDEYQRNCNAFYHKGTLNGEAIIGDASWACSEYLPSQSMTSRFGNVAVLVLGTPSHMAAKQQLQQDFPASALEAIVYQTLLRASQETALTGVPAHSEHLAVNTHSLPKNALKVSGHVYVPVQEFAKAMGLTSHWNSKTGALTLTGANRKPITLTAGSTAANIGGAKAAALTVPVLKDGGEPVMTLDDLLRLTGGRITSHAGNTVQVKG
jgi:hypothetical protein